MIDPSDRIALIEAHKRRIPYKASLLEDGLEPPDLTISEWVPLFKACWVCGWKEGRHNKDGKIALQVHHIERRSQASKRRINVTANFFRTCNRCHETVLATMPHRMQLAYKWANDSCGFPDLDSLILHWLQIKDPELKAPNRVSVDDVLEAYVELGLEIIQIP